MTSDLDHLDLELRSIPGVVAVGFDTDRAGLVVQVVAIGALAPADLRTRVRRIIDGSASPASLELVVEPGASLLPADARN